MHVSEEADEEDRDVHVSSSSYDVHVSSSSYGMHVSKEADEEIRAV
jgi:hypothetical protein